ncbi:MAG: hypothetical protein HKP61_12505 [Dactylosporangium sp.]|nr:hypothetical protein [Dactylosporangium sp.]NNJ61741.1 hypothetical protein [Dactylosporangium sp.]
MLLATVTAAGLLGALAAALAAASAFAFCVAVFIAVNHRPWDRRKRQMVAATVASGTVLVVMALCAGVPDKEDTDSRQSGGSAPAGERSTLRPLSPTESTIVNQFALSSEPPGPACHTASPPLRPANASSAEEIRHEGELVLPPGYYADLDTICTDWLVNSEAESRHDLVNDGTGLLRADKATEMALLEDGAVETFAECVANTNYLSTTIPYRDLRKGNRYCVRTNKGRRSLVTIVDVGLDQQRTVLRLNVITWAPVQHDDSDDDTWKIVAFIIVLMMVFGGGTTAAVNNRSSENKSP